MRPAHACQHIPTVALWSIFSLYEWNHDRLHAIPRQSQGVVYRLTKGRSPLGQQGLSRSEEEH